MLVQADPRWYTTGWALAAPPTGSLATTLNLNSWSAGVADRGPPNQTPTWDPGHLVDDGQIGSIIHPLPVLPPDYLPPTEVSAAVERTTPEQFKIAFGVDPEEIHKLSPDQLQKVAGDNGVDMMALLWACQRMAAKRSASQRSS